MIFKNRRLIFIIFILAATLFIFVSIMKKKIEENRILCVEIECQGNDVVQDPNGKQYYPSEVK
jgi:hypothetical protein